MKSKKNKRMRTIKMPESKSSKIKWNDELYSLASRGFGEARVSLREDFGGVSEAKQTFDEQNWMLGEVPADMEGMSELEMFSNKKKNSSKKKKSCIRMA